MDIYETYLVNWTGLPSILGTQEFETSSEFDALSRATKITLPEDVNTERKEIIPTYNRSGALVKVDFNGTEYVKNIIYSAKGQRLLIAFGNDLMTRYIYDKLTFRLQRQRSEKYAKTQTGNIITYMPQSGTNKQDDGFNFDLVGNILKILNRVADCGITGSSLGANALDREFEYDPLYRLTEADGRESDTQDQNDYLYSDAPTPGNPNANNVRAYTRQFNYDKIGNVQRVKQLGINGFTRNFIYNASVNTLQKIETGSSALIQDFTYDNVGNQISAGTTRNYIWNAGNQLIAYYNQIGISDPTIFAQYDYSGMNRVSKMVRTGTSGSPIYERTIYIDGIFEYHILEMGTIYEKNYVHILDGQSRIAMVRIGMAFPNDIADTVTYNLEDQIGSNSVRLNISGGVIDKEEYYPFGDSSLRTFSKKRYRYVGKEKDLESGLYYYGARYYAAWTCRFISIDPLAADYPYLTPYNYAGNKPIAFKDIDGLQGEGDPPVEGSIQQVNGVQQVYTGAGEDQGWKNTNNTESFQGGAGSSVFFREGEAGSYTYRKIENVVIEIKGQLENKSSAGNGNTWLIEANDIEDAAKMFSEKFGEYTVGTLVLATHGALDAARTNIGLQGTLGTSQRNNPDRARLSIYGIRNAKQGAQNEITDTEYKDGVAFNKLVGAVMQNGTLIIAACTVGQDDALLKEISKVTRSNVTIYANQDYTKQALYSDNSFHLDSEPFKLGWVRWGIINADKIESKGRKPRYGAINIGNKSWVF